MKVEQSKNEDKPLSAVYKSPAIMCSCMLEMLEPIPVGRTEEPARHAVLINRLEAEEIYFEARERFEKEYLCKLNLSPVGGIPFSLTAKILDVSSSSRQGFYLAFARFENLTPRQRQSVLALISSTNMAGMNNTIS